MIELIALFAFYITLSFIALYSFYYVYEQLTELLRDLLEEIHDERVEGIGKEKEEKHGGSGQAEGRAELSGSNGEHEAEEEE